MLTNYPLQVIMAAITIIVLILFFVFKSKESKYKEVEEEIHQKEAAKMLMQEFYKQVDNGEMLFM